MQTKLIQIKDYLLLVDEEAEIQKGDLKICLNDNYISKYLSKQNIESDTKCSDCKKIIAYYPLTKEVQELDLPLLPPFEIDTYKMFEIVDGTCEKGGYEHWLFDQGYTAAQSKQFSLEDINKAIAFGFGICRKEDRAPFNLEIIEFIQSLSTQQLPKEFIPKYDRIRLPKGDDGWEDVHQVKIITNSEGKEELIGIYKY